MVLIRQVGGLSVTSQNRMASDPRTSSRKFQGVIFTKLEVKRYRQKEKQKIDSEESG